MSDSRSEILWRSRRSVWEVFLYNLTSPCINKQHLRNTHVVHEKTLAWNWQQQQNVIHQKTLSISSVSFFFPTYRTEAKSITSHIKLTSENRFPPTNNTFHLFIIIVLIKLLQKYLNRITTQQNSHNKRCWIGLVFSIV